MYEDNFAKSQVLRLGAAALSQGWRRALRPRDEPHVHARGANPVRILFIGDSLAVGYGVLSHTLGFGGSLARQLSQTIRRGVDIDIVTERRFSPRDAIGAIDALNLADYDAVVVSIGAMDTIKPQRDDAWREEVRALFERLEGVDALPFFVVGIPTSDTAGRELSIVRRFVQARSRALTRILADEAAWAPSATFIPLVPVPGRKFAQTPDRTVYEQWAKQVVPYMAPLVANATHASFPQDEDARQAGLDGLAILDSPDEDRFNRIASTARNLFGTTAAAITFLDRDRQWTKSAVGEGPARGDMPRIEAFCDVTIQSSSLFVVEDLTLDERFRDNRAVAGPAHFRFYAGYPLEDRTGMRVGALCVLDTEVRSFSTSDAAMLRDLALQVQDEVWWTSVSE